MSSSNTNSVDHVLLLSVSLLAKPLQVSNDYHTEKGIILLHRQQLLQPNPFIHNSCMCIH